MGILGSWRRRRRGESGDGLECLGGSWILSGEMIAWCMLSERLGLVERASVGR